MANPPAIPSLAPTAVAVWGVAAESLVALRKLRDICPSADTDAGAFLRDCQALANQLLESPNLKTSTNRTPGRPCAWPKPETSSNTP